MGENWPCRGLWMRYCLVWLFLGSRWNSGYSISFPKKIASRRFRIDVCVLNIYSLHLNHFSISLRSKIFIGSEKWSLSPWTHTFLPYYLKIWSVSSSTLRAERMDHLRSILTWASIFVVKVCFPAVLLWYAHTTSEIDSGLEIIFGMTILFWALCTCAIFFSCPHFAKTTGKSAMPL